MAIGADHGEFHLKTKIASFVCDLGHQVQDLCAYDEMMPGTVMYVYFGSLAGSLAELGAKEGGHARQLFLEIRDIHFVDRKHEVW